MPGRWLVKTEPSSYSFSDLQRERRTAWEGVANALALIHLRAMAEGDSVLVYHSGSKKPGESKRDGAAQKSVVGLAKVAKGPYPDPSIADPKRVVVDLEAVAPAKTPVSIDALRGEKACADLALLRQSRLSVMPVSEAAWKAISRLAGFS